MKLPENARLLIIEDEDAVLRGLATFFSDSGYQVLCASDGVMGMELFARERPEIVFTDLRMPNMGGLEVIRAVRDLSPDTPVIVISGTGLASDALEAKRSGAWDYVEKPVLDLVALEHMVRRALENSLLRGQVAGLKQKLLSGGLQCPAAFSAFDTCSASLQNLFLFSEVIAGSGLPLLICGEKGTGKGLLAHAVHTASARPGKFVSLNVAGLDHQALSDALFGPQHGGAPALIVQAAGGTLFLKGIDELEDASQESLLRLLREGEYVPRGCDYPLLSDARVVLASQRDLGAMNALKLLRSDLSSRLAPHQVLLPPLRERPDDIPLLLERFLCTAALSQQKSTPVAPPELAGLLSSYGFPGNVRELETMVFEAVARHNSGVLSGEIFHQALGRDC
jgi:DNA-binding NtrC family response regulator